VLWKNYVFLFIRLSSVSGTQNIKLSSKIETSALNMGHNNTSFLRCSTVVGSLDVHEGKIRNEKEQKYVYKSKEKKIKISPNEMEGSLTWRS
jgi:hypothetical protein